MDNLTKRMVKSQVKKSVIAFLIIALLISIGYFIGIYQGCEALVKENSEKFDCYPKGQMQTHGIIQYRDTQQELQEPPEGVEGEIL